MSNVIPWWKKAVIYQIYPKSFQDTTGNGRGDLIGIIRRLDYLATLGIDAICLTPIYPSPQIDNGYDIADYCAVDPEYGSMDDFETLVQQAHQRHIRIVMDMVFNHTSTQHPWFKAAQNKNSPYRPFYIWRDGTDKKAEPNNWQSKFGGSAWQWHAVSGQYYLHLFSTEQADLNWEHEPVRQQLKNVGEFWADKGVDALRLDVINLVSKQQNFPDDPETDGRNYYTDGPRIHDFLREFNRDLFQPKKLMTVGEMSSTHLEQCKQYAALDGSELSMTFNFHHLKVDYTQGNKWTVAKPDFVELKRLFSHWQTGMHNQAWSALFWCNHDQPRIVSRFADNAELRVVAAKMLAMVLHGMQGTPYIYQGEEIGMTNPNFNQIDDYRDIESLNMYTEKSALGIDDQQILTILAQKSRDNSRTPMQWNDQVNAGFSQGTPWIKLSNNHSKVNVQAALLDKTSVFYTYQHLIKLRKELNILTEGNYCDLVPEHPKLWCYTRCWQNQILLVTANLSDQPQYWSLPTALSNQQWKTIFSNYSLSPFNVSQTVIQLQPYQANYFIAYEQINAEAQAK